MCTPNKYKKLLFCMKIDIKGSKATSRTERNEKKEEKDKKMKLEVAC